MDSEQAWLEKILTRDLGPVQAPAALRTMLDPPRRRSSFATGVLAWAAGILLAIAAGVAGHAYLARAVSVQAAGGGVSSYEAKRVVALVKPVNLQGACHLCHASEAL